MIYRAAIVCVLILGITSMADAQTVAELERTTLIEQLFARVQELEKLVEELERKSLRTTDAALAEVASLGGIERIPVETPQAPGSQSVGQLIQEELPVYPDLKISGFGDFNYSDTDKPGSNSGFNIGQVILHLASPLSSRVSVFSEIHFQGTPGLERAIIRFDQSDYLKVSFGRYHTPINYWNTSFHHGLWLQTSISRPEVTKFGGQFLPVHLFGALVEGSVPAGGLNVNYNFGIANGRGTNISASGDSGDNNNNRATLMTLFVKPDALFGLQVGGSLYRDEITLAGGQNFREWISAAHLVWQKEAPEFIAEFTNVNHQDLDGSSSFNSQSFYAQVGYRVNKWKPYYRFEYIHTPPSDPVFRDLPNLLGSTVGVRYDLSDFAALKFEFRNQRRRGEPRVNGAFLQTSFAF